MTFSETMLAVLGANGLTALLIYSLLKLKKEGDSWGAIGTALLAAFLIGLVGYAAR